jgi:uncharacterized protein (TIGR03437 family)
VVTSTLLRLATLALFIAGSSKFAAAQQYVIYTVAGGAPAPTPAPPPAPVLPVSVTIGGQVAQILYAGGAPGEVAGLMQINVQIPDGVQAGNAVPVVVKVGGVSSQAGVTIAVR